MGSTDVANLLRTYGIRRELARDGISHPPPRAVAFMDKLLERLSQLDQNEQIEIDIQEDTHQTARFIRALTGEVLASIEMNSNREGGESP